MGGLLWQQWILKAMSHKRSACSNEGSKNYYHHELMNVYIFHVLSFIVVIILFGAKMVLYLANESLFQLMPLSFWHESLSWIVLSLSGTRYLRLILHISCSSVGIGYFSKEPWLLLEGTSILETTVWPLGVFITTRVINSRTLQWTEKGNSYFLERVNNLEFKLMCLIHIK